MKPKCELIGKDGNVFNIISLVKKALIKAGQKIRPTSSLNPPLRRGATARF